MDITVLVDIMKAESFCKVCQLDKCDICSVLIILHQQNMYDAASAVK